MPLSIEQIAWRDGVKAFEEGKSRSSNPHVNGSTGTQLALSAQWFSGWDSAEVIIGSKEKA